MQQFLKISEKKKHLLLSSQKSVFRMNEKNKKK